MICQWCLILWRCTGAVSWRTGSPYYHFRLCAYMLLFYRPCLHLFQSPGIWKQGVSTFNTCRFRSDVWGGIAKDQLGFLVASTGFWRLAGFLFCHAACPCHFRPPGNNAQSAHKHFFPCSHGYYLPAMRLRFLIFCETLRNDDCKFI